MKKIKKLFSFLGPGFITGAADDDPSGIVAYSQAGAQFGLQNLWTAPFSFPFMYAVQEMCARIGLVSGKGLAGVIKSHYSRWLLYFSVLLLFIANTINISTDLGAMAASLELLFGFPFFFWIIVITVITLLLEIFVSYKVYSKYLKYLAFSLLFYVATAFFVNIDFRKVLFSTIIPNFTFSKEYIFNIVAILGTTISPYLFFWQSYEEVEEEIVEGKIKCMGAGIPKVYKRDIEKTRIDTAFGMFFSNLIMWFIILVAGLTFYTLGIKDINTPGDAAIALKPLAGEHASLFFTLGILGTGLLAVPILAGSCSYALSEVLGLKVGLSQKLKNAHGFYGAITIAMLVGLLINFIGLSPMRALYYTAILNGIVAPPLIFIILLVANNEKIMGARKNGRFSNIFGLIIAVIMTILSLLLLLSLFGII